MYGKPVATSPTTEELLSLHASRLLLLLASILARLFGVSAKAVDASVQQASLHVLPAIFAQDETLCETQ